MSKEFICKGCGEKFNKDMQSNNVGYCYICNEFYMRKQVADLEAKLAESEKLKENYDILRCQHKSLGEFCEELKQQLAEKEAEIKSLVLAHFESDTNKPVLTTTEIINQDKISFCIDKLVDIQKYISDNPIGVEQECFGKEINEFIDNQIEELKKEMK